MTQSLLAWSFSSPSSSFPASTSSSASSPTWVVASVPRVTREVSELESKSDLVSVPLIVVPLVCICDAFSIVERKQGKAESSMEREEEKDSSMWNSTLVLMWSNFIKVVRLRNESMFKTAFVTKSSNKHIQVVEIATKVSSLIKPV